jgi:REP element-mobilizing transposase RayT
MNLTQQGRANRPGEPSGVLDRVVSPEAIPAIIELTDRKPLGHRVPGWVKPESLFFVTICAAKRNGAPLLAAGRGARLIASVLHVHEAGAWFARLFLVMPDHVHGIFAFPMENTMAKRVAAWKSYTAKTLGIEWQERFFDHRLRSNESPTEKALYIRMNPVRAGLVSSPEAWSFVFDSSVEDGSAGTPRPTF